MNDESAREPAGNRPSRVRALSVDQVWTIAAFCILIATSFFVYDSVRVDWPDNDHVVYINERNQLPSDWAWFWHSISYSRTRFSGAGDYFLFRPAHLFVLVMEDIFLRRQLQYTGAASILFQALSAFALYVFSSRMLRNRLLAFAMALLYLGIFCGVQIVVWRHISPYILSLACFAAGLSLLRSSRFIAASAAFAIASLFHEFVLVALVLSLVVLMTLLFSARTRERPIGEKRSILFCLGSALGVSLLLNATDYMLHRPPSILSPADHPYSSLLTDYANLIATMISAASSALLWPPFDANFHPWLFVEAHGGIGHALGFLVGAMLCWTLVQSFRDYRNSANPIRASIAILSCCSVIGLILGVAVGRGILRGPGYIIKEGGQYWSMTSFCLILVLACFLGESSAAGPSRRWKRSIQYSVLVLLALLATVNIAQARHTLPLRYEDRARKSAELFSIADAIVANHVCLAGYDSVGFPEGPLQYTLLRDLACSYHPGTPVYLLRDPLGQLSLAKKGATVLDRLTDADFAPSSWWSVTGDTRLRPTRSQEKLAILTTKQEAENQSAFSVRVNVRAGDFYGGLAANYRDEDNYLAFSVDGRSVTVTDMAAGKSSQLASAYLPARMDIEELELRRVGPTYYFFVNEYLLVAARAPGSGGHVGVFIRGGNSNVEFAEPRIRSRSSESFDQLFTDSLPIHEVASMRPPAGLFPRGLFPRMVTASSSSDPRESARPAADLNVHTFWTSAPGTASNYEELVLVLGSSQRVTGFKWLPREGLVEAAPREFLVELSADGETWTTVASEDKHVPASGVWWQGKFSPRAAHLVRFRMKTMPHAGAFYAQVAECVAIAE